MVPLPVQLTRGRMLHSWSRCWTIHSRNHCQYQLLLLQALLLQPPQPWCPPVLRVDIDCHILNFTALSVVGVLQYSLLPLSLCNLICDGLYLRNVVSKNPAMPLHTWRQWRQQLSRRNARTELPAGPPTWARFRYPRQKLRHSQTGGKRSCHDLWHCELNF